jgi:transposase
VEYCSSADEKTKKKNKAKAIDDLIKHRTGTTPIIITLDNASIHHSEEMLEAQDTMEARGTHD